MPAEALVLMIEDTGLAAAALNDAAGRLDPAEGELVLDFSSLDRLDSGSLRAMENLARAAEERAVKVTLRGVSAGVYKVLKLTKLAQRLSFVG